MYATHSLTEIRHPIKAQADFNRGFYYKKKYFKIESNKLFN